MEGGMNRGRLTATACNMIDLDCHGAQLGVIARRQIKDQIIPTATTNTTIAQPTSKQRNISIFN